MKAFSLILACLGTAVCTAEPGDAPKAAGPEPAAPPAKQGQEEKTHASPGEGARPRMGRQPFGRRMNEGERRQFIYFHHLFMEKYDKNKSGLLEPEEMEAVKADAERFRKERSEMLLKKFDKNGDGKLDDEEKAEMKKVLMEEIEKRQKKHQNQKAVPERKKKGEEAAPDQEGRRQGQRREGFRGPGPEPGKPGEGKPGEKREGPPRGGPGHPRGGAPAEVIMLHGYHLMMEKHDKDKDGKLSEEELKSLKEDRDAFLKKWEEEHKKRREQWEAKRNAQKAEPRS